MRSAIGGGHGEEYRRLRARAADQLAVDTPTRQCPSRKMFR